MFESQAAIQADAEQLIRAYISFKDGGELDAATDTRNGGKKVHELRGLVNRAKAFALTADRYIAQASFTSLPQAVQNDVRAISEECSALVADVEDEIEPDKKIAKLSREQKAAVTDNLIVDDMAMKHARARLKGEKRVIGKPEPGGPDSTPKPDANPSPKK